MISFAVVLGLVVLCSSLDVFLSNVDSQQDLRPRFLQFISLSLKILSLSGGLGGCQVMGSDFNSTPRRWVGTTLNSFPRALLSERLEQAKAINEQGDHSVDSTAAPPGNWFPLMSRTSLFFDCVTSTGSLRSRRRNR